MPSPAVEDTEVNTQGRQLGMNEQGHRHGSCLAGARPGNHPSPALKEKRGRDTPFKINILCDKTKWPDVIWYHFISWQPMTLRLHLLNRAN